MIATIEEMTGMLEDILTLARSGRSGEPTERIDAAALVRSLAQEYREMGQPVTADTEGIHFVIAQPNLLKRAIRNLVDNAIKYGSEAAVEVRRVGHRVEIEVLDRGPGLSDEDLAKVTGAFYRAEPSRNRETGGAGLGLTIAQAIVEAQGGTLSLANRGGGGLTGTIALQWAPND
jgi:signal transduction histidine kinase